MTDEQNKVIVWFSCGAASAVAAKIALEKYGPQTRFCYTDTGSEHRDNVRFISDCEKWLGIKVEVLRSKEYKDTWEVFEKNRFLSSPQGARCTAALKKIPSRQVLEVGDVEVFGYTAEESKRLERFKQQNPERVIDCPLIDKHLTKQDCFGILHSAGIELPAMYKLGFRNNNCIACVKARDSIDYWKRIRKYFPEQFLRMATLERELSYPINRIGVKGERKKIFLDEIPDGEPEQNDPDISCGLFCGTESSE